MNQAKQKCRDTIGLLASKQALMAAIMHQRKAAAQEKNKQHEKRGRKRQCLRAQRLRCYAKAYGNSNDGQNRAGDLPKGDAIIARHVSRQLEINSPG